MKIVLITAILIGTTFSQAATIASTPETFAGQLAAAKNKYLPMSTRWSALIKASNLADHRQIDSIKQFTRSEDWYMRNAALVALKKFGQEYADAEAKKLVSDKALVVRSAAVDILAQKMTLDNKAILIGELSKSYNFKGKQSLWVRPQIVNHLVRVAEADDQRFFAKCLFDQDIKISQAAVKALTKITSISFSGKDRVKKWQSLVKEKGWL